jgi:hypothetical protein
MHRIGIRAAAHGVADRLRLWQSDPRDLALGGGECRSAGDCTGRSDLPNQLNNSLVFPGLFRGVLDVRARSTPRPDVIVDAPVP